MKPWKAVLAAAALGTPIALAADALQPADAADAVPMPYRTAVVRALASNGLERARWLEVFARVPERQREGLAFLLTNMPGGDLRQLDPGGVAENVRLAYEARGKAPWGARIPEEVFLNDVLPYAVVDEARDPWRQDFCDRLSADAWACGSPGEAAVLLNKTIFRALGVRYSAVKRKKPNQSPAESMQIGWASCTGLSILLVDACRAVGIPARMAGIPAWKDGVGDASGNHGGNHSWVEILDGAWHYLGAAEPSDLDRTWFSGKTRGPGVDAADPAHRVYATSFRRSALAFPLVWAPGSETVPAVDVTARYLGQQDGR
jgi:hypothetical protein